MNNKIYGGIYTSGPSKKTDNFIMDPYLTQAEKAVSKYYLLETLAHNYMLATTRLIPEKSGKKVIKGLLELIENFDEDTYVDASLGDVHENTEKKLAALIGNDAGWVHVARSRNDQSATDQKLFAKENLTISFEKLGNLVKLLIQKSNEYKNVIMPGFTHLRVATPSTFGFWWQAYASQILDEIQILQRVYDVQNKSPLGAGTSYGVNWPINPELTAKSLGFAKPFTNALAEINSRGINEIHILSSFTSILTILSRMMEDLVIWSMPELNLIEIGEEFTTGSSIMPQKMNPDVAEKIRSKVGNITGNLTATIINIKGTPSGYNRDSADTKIAITKGFQEFLDTIDVASAMLEKIVPNQEEMKKPIKTALATKLADEICKTFQIPFRQTHEIIGSSIKVAGGKVENITDQILQDATQKVTGTNTQIPEGFVSKALNVETALNQYEYKGSPNPEFIAQVNKELLTVLEEINVWNKNEQKNFEDAISNLLKLTKKYCE